MFWEDAKDRRISKNKKKEVGKKIKVALQMDATAKTTLISINGKVVNSNLVITLRFPRTVLCRRQSGCVEVQLLCADCGHVID